MLYSPQLPCCQVVAMVTFLWPGRKTVQFNINVKRFLLFLSERVGLMFSHMNSCCSDWFLPNSEYEAVAVDLSTKTGNSWITDVASTWCWSSWKDSLAVWCFSFLTDALKPTWAIQTLCIHSDHVQECVYIKRGYHGDWSISVVPVVNVEWLPVVMRTAWINCEGKIMSDTSVFLIMHLWNISIQNIICKFNKK